MYEDNRREIIEFEISVSIGTQDTTYDYNDEFWNYIKIFWFQFFHINESNCYVLFLLEFSAPQGSTVVFLFKERKYFFLFIAIGT